MVGNIDYHIIDRCNLNCASCNHFSSLVPASDKEKSIKQITADLTLLSKIDTEFETLTLLGGEPTLHPQLSQILRIARGILPNNTIKIITNGTAYNHMERWKDALVETNTGVVVSIYPYCHDYRERFEMIRNTLEPEVKIEVVEMPENAGFNYGFLSNDCGVATETEIINCYRRYYCLQLKDGKVYICHFAAQFNRLKDYFGDQVSFDLDGKEYFDLNGDVDINQFYEFAHYSRPNICDHCLDVHNGGWAGDTHPWGTTRKDIHEWVL